MAISVESGCERVLFRLKIVGKYCPTGHGRPFEAAPTTPERGNGPKNGPKISFIIQPRTVQPKLHTILQGSTDGRTVAGLHTKVGQYLKHCSKCQKINVSFANFYVLVPQISHSSTEMSISTSRSTEYFWLYGGTNKCSPTGWMVLNAQSTRNGTYKCANRRGITFVHPV